MLDVITGLLAVSLMCLGLALWSLWRRRRIEFLQSKIIAATSCGVAITNATVPRHPVLSVNAAFRLLTGYAEEDVVGQSLSILNGSLTDRGMIERLAMAIQDGRACRVLVRHYRKNGMPFWNEVTLSPVKNRAGVVTRYIWVMSDATQRQEAEHALKDSHIPVCIMSDSVAEGVIVATEGTVVHINAGALTILGAASSDEIIGQPLNRFLDADAFPMVRQQLNLRHPEERVQSTAGRLFRIQGDPVKVELSACPIVWKEKPSCLIILSQAPSQTVAHAAVDQLQAQLQSVEAAAHLGNWERDLSTGQESWSTEHYRILGYEPGSIMPTADTLASALHPEDRERVLAVIQQALHSHTHFDVECRVIQSGGAIRFVHYRGNPRFDSAGHPIRLSGTIRDVTEYKLIEEVAKERDVQFKLAIESAPGGMLMIREDGAIFLVNAQIEGMFGYSREELLGRPLELLLPEQHWACPMPNPTSVAGTGKECFGRRKDGSRFPIDIGFNPIHVSSGVSVLVTIFDITDRRQAEEALRQSQERLDLAVRAGHVGIFEHHHRTDTLYWSPTLRGIYGVSAEEPVSLQRYIELLPREERDGALSAIRTAHDPDGEGSFQLEHRIVRTGGEIRHVSVQAQTFFSGEGSARIAVRTIGTVVDITNRKHAVTHVRDSCRMEAIGTLTGGIAHEFNNSLTAVLGFSELTLPLLPPDSKAYRHVQQVITAGRKSRELVHQLLAFSQQRDQVRRPLFLHSLLKESLKLLRPTVPSWIELRERIVVSTRPVSADMTQLHQLIVNLVENALYAMRQTGGILEIQLQDKELTADQATPYGRLAAGCYTCLTVCDSGEGLEPEVAGRIFDPLFNTKPLGEGHGMKWSAIHDIVTAHGGTVLVDSLPGLATTVSVYLPTLPPRAVSAPLADEPLPHGHECILFVDDEESLARFGGEMLESLGYYPVVRVSASEAWEAFKVAPQRFDLLITDQTMPGMSGDRLARECQRLRPDLPIILCTGSDQTSAEEARLEGVTEYVSKPLMLRDLAQAIRRILDLPEPVLKSGTMRELSLSIEEDDAVSARR